MNAGQTKAITRQVLKKSHLGNEELSFVDKFRYQGHVTANCRDDKDIEKQSGGNIQLAI